MNWKETINNNLREAYSFFFELELKQHNFAQISALKHFGEIIGVDFNNKEEFVKFLTSPEGKKFMVLFRKESSKIPNVDNPKEWGKMMAQKIHNELTAEVTNA